MLQTYFGSLGSNWDTVMSLPVDGIGLDFVRDGGNLRDLQSKGFPQDKVLGAGVLNARAVWKADLARTLGLLETIAEKVGKDRIVVGPSASMLFLPHDVRLESAHDADVLANLSFAEQRLDEIAILAKGLNEGRDAIKAELDADAARLSKLEASVNTNTRERMASLTDADFRRAEPFSERVAAQQQHINLPPYPTTTIGSFPQSPDVRSMRLKFRTGKITPEEYERWVQGKMDELVAQQEAVGLDVLVHGEFERSDMVEYFGEHLGGFIATEHGWVQSYGSRCVRPPIIVGDVYRDHPMTVEDSRLRAVEDQQADEGHADRPGHDPQLVVRARRHAALGGLLTRSRWRCVTKWSDLEAAGIRIVQIDEPALREGLPLRRAHWAEYLDWAVKAFRLSASSAAPATQIHTHMCYSEFNDIIDSIDAMDADVISIENSRSNEELLARLHDQQVRADDRPRRLRHPLAGRPGHRRDRRAAQARDRRPRRRDPLGQPRLRPQDPQGRGSLAQPGAHGRRREGDA